MPCKHSKIEVAEQRKWACSTLWPNYHSFIIEDSLLGSHDTGEGKFSTFQIRSNAVLKSLLPKAFDPFSVRLFDCLSVQKK